MELTTERLSMYRDKHKNLMNKIDNNLKETNNKLEQIKVLLKMN